MPVKSVIDHERKLVISTAWGVLTAAEAFSHRDGLASDPEFRPEYDQLIDFTATTKIQMDAENLRSLAQRNFFSSSSRRAVLVNSNVAFGIARMLVTFRELAGAKEEMGIFRDHDEAMRWIAAPKTGNKL
jgi:hypothetical protein